MITKKDLMLCDKITEEELPTLKGEWKANIKFDGERIAIIKKDGEVFLLNRAGRIKNNIYFELIPTIKAIEGDFILDGEVITQDGLFNSLQHRSNLSDKNKIIKAKTDYPIKYCVFDLLYYGKDLRQKPLKERIQILKENFESKLNGYLFELVKYQEIQEALSFAKSHKLEGVVIKNMNAYYEGRRSNNWLKLKLFKQAEMKAISYIENNAGLRLEDDKKNAVQCSGNQSCIVKNEIDKNGYCNIVIQYLEKTKDDRFRFISFVGVKENGDWKVLK
jgi:DNA ligase-1